jgi:hypothetical protein
VNKVKKKTANLLPKLTEVEQDLLSHMQDGYQLETDSLGGNPVLRRLKDNEEIRPLSETAAIESAVQRLRPKLMTVCAVLASLIPILGASGIGSDVMKPIAAPMVGGMITSTIHVLILVPVFFVLMKERALRRGMLRLELAE